MEKRKRYHDAYTKAETRKTDDGKMYIEGMIPYNSDSEEMWGWKERIAPGAFKRTLNNKSKVYAFWGHDDTRILGASDNGSLILEDREDGLHFSVELRDTEAMRDYYEAVARGDVNGVSFGFFTEKEEWDQSSDPMLRTLKQVHLLEVSPGVAFPAYPGAQSDAARRTLYEEGGPEFRSRLKNQQPPAAPAADTPAPATDTDDPPPEESREALVARQSAELDLVCAEYGLGN